MRRSQSAGFTLVELLLAMSLLVLIVSSIVGGLQFGRRVWDRSAADEASIQVEAASRALAGLLARALPVTASAKGAAQRLVFSGRADGIRFVALSDGEVLDGGPVLTEFGVAVAAGRPVLQLWSKVFRAETAWSTERAAMRATSVLSGVSSISLSYFGSDNSDEQPTWRPTWLNQTDLPLLVSLRIVAERQGQRFDVPVTVALRQR